jgi:hypothetical protein
MLSREMGVQDMPKFGYQAVLLREREDNCPRRRLSIDDRFPHPSWIPYLTAGESHLKLCDLFVKFELSSFPSCLTALSCDFASRTLEIPA